MRSLAGSKRKEPDNVQSNCTNDFYVGPHGDLPLAFPVAYAAEKSKTLDLRRELAKEALLAEDAYADKMSKTVRPGTELVKEALVAKDFRKDRIVFPRVADRQERPIQMLQCPGQLFGYICDGNPGRCDWQGQPFCCQQTTDPEGRCVCLMGGC